MEIKAKALANFITEFTHDVALELEMTLLEAKTPEKQVQEDDLTMWKLFVDESSNQHNCGAGLVLQISVGELMEYAICIGFKATTNEAEYEAFLARLRVVSEFG